MDLGIRGKSAIVCAASKGLGRGCAEALAREGVELTICARGKEALEATAEHLRQLGAPKVTAIACDVTTEEGRRALLEAWCEAGRTLVDFEIVPVRTSAEAVAVMAARHS